MAQLDWLWSSKNLNRKLCGGGNSGVDETSVAEVAKQLDKDFQLNENFEHNGQKEKPVYRSVHHAQAYSNLASSFYYNFNFNSQLWPWHGQRYFSSLG